jgi:hypothetical protein
MGPAFFVRLPGHAFAPERFSFQGPRLSETWMGKIA